MESESCSNQEDTNVPEVEENPRPAVREKCYYVKRSESSSERRRSMSRLLNTAQSRNIPKDDVTSLCRQMEDMNAHKGFKPCEKERKKRILQRLRKLVDSYKNNTQSDDEDD